jgi:putative N6-adenine-specific DNA methylase
MPKWYAVAAPGLEQVVAGELERAGVNGTIEPGGVAFEATIPEGAVLAHRLRTPARLLLVVCEGRVGTPDELVGLVRKGDWKSLVHPFATLDVSASAERSRLRFREAAEKKVSKAIAEAIKGPRVMDRERRPAIAQRVQLRIVDDQASLSIDAGGELLHVRGWRSEQGPASIRENLAASLLCAAGWTPDEPLLDPFCGSGTILIEAGLLAAGRSPFVGRALACDEWPGPPHKKGQKPPKAAPTAVGPRPSPRLHGADRDARVLAAAASNARRAKIELDLRRIDVADVEPPASSGLLLTNPPYGVRLASEAQALHATWRAFGQTLADRVRGWRAGWRRRATAHGPQARAERGEALRRQLL